MSPRNCTSKTLSPRSIATQVVRTTRPILESALTLCNLFKESVYSHSKSFRLIPQIRMSFRVHNEFQMNEDVNGQFDSCACVPGHSFVFCRRLKYGMDMSRPGSNATKFFHSGIVKQLRLEKEGKTEKVWKKMRLRTKKRRSSPASQEVRRSA